MAMVEAPVLCPSSSSSTMMVNSGSVSSRKRQCPENSNNHNTKKRRVLHGASVRFSATLSERTIASLFEGLTAAQEEQLRANLWYTRQEGDDRLQTIRIWRALGGNTRLLEPNYCLRGLETLQSTLMNGELQMKRTQHLAAVLNEQERQRSVKVRDTDQLAQVSLAHTSWAVERASRFAVKDAVDAQAYQMSSSSSSSSLLSPVEPFHKKSSHSKLPSFSDICSKVPSLAPIPHSTTTTPSLMSLRHMMMPKLKSSSSTAASRECLAKYFPTTTSSTTTTAAPTTTRNRVDVNKLKQMNMQFLQGLTQATPALSNNTSSSSSLNKGTLDLLTEALNATEGDSSSSF